MTTRLRMLALALIWFAALAGVDAQRSRPTPVGTGNPAARTQGQTTDRSPVFSNRADLTRFLCSAFRGGDIASAVRNFQGIDSFDPDRPLSESARNEGTYTTVRLNRAGLNGELTYSYMRFADGQTRNHHLEIDDKDQSEGVWFENLTEAREWLQGFGLLTKTESYGVNGSAKESEAAGSRRDRSSDPIFDFTVSAMSIGRVEVRWNTADQVRFGLAFCSAR